MTNNYTLGAEQRCYELANKDDAALWEDINASPEDLPRDMWKKKMQSISNEFLLSSRFALMRLVSDQIPKNTNGGFSVFVEGKELFFSKVEIGHAKEFGEKQHKKELAGYEKLLLNKAKEHALANGETIDELTSLALVRKALQSKSYSKYPSLIKQEADQAFPRMTQQHLTEHVNKRLNKIKSYQKARLSRTEAMQLGHLLDFTLEQMQWFLLRTFDYDEGFRYNSSADLIDAYGFLTHASQKTVNKLKSRYLTMSEDIPALPIDQKAEDWTQDIEESLPEKCRIWSPDDRENLFLNWLIEKAPFLDRVSQSALVVYRNLAAAAVFPATEGIDDYNLIEMVLNATNGEESDLIRKRMQSKNASSEKAFYYDISERLLLDNQYISQSKQADRSRAYCIPTVNSKKQLSIASGINSGRYRVYELLMGKEAVQKSDILHVVWLLATVCWDISESEKEIFCTSRIKEFINAASICLYSANLPPFYIPHLLEQSMLLAIIQAGSEADPSEVYEQICNSIIVERDTKNKEHATSRE